MKALLILAIIVLIIYLLYRWLFRRDGPPIVLGFPNPDEKKMGWSSKPPKSRWDKFKEWGPQAAIASLIAFCLGLAVGLTF